MQTLFSTLISLLFCCIINPDGQNIHLEDQPTEKLAKSEQSGPGCKEQLVCE